MIQTDREDGTTLASATELRCQFKLRGHRR